MTDMERDKGFNDPGVSQVLQDTKALIEDVQSLGAKQDLPTSEAKADRFAELLRAWETLESYQFTLREYQTGKRQLPQGYLDTYTRIAYSIISVDQQMLGLGIGYYARFQRAKVEKLSEAIWLHGGESADTQERRVVKEAVRNVSSAIPDDIAPDDAKEIARFMREFGTRL